MRNQLIQNKSELDKVLGRVQELEQERDRLGGQIRHCTAERDKLANEMEHERGRLVDQIREIKTDRDQLAKELEFERRKAAATIARLTSERDRVTEERVGTVEQYGELLKVVEESKAERDRLAGTTSHLQASRDQLTIRLDELSREHASLAGQFDGLRLERHQLLERNNRLSQACETPPARFGDGILPVINILLVIYALSHIVKSCRQIYKGKDLGPYLRRQTKPTGPHTNSTKRPAEPTARGPATEPDDPAPSQKAEPTSSTPPSEVETPSSPRTLDRSIRRLNSRLSSSRAWLRITPCEFTSKARSFETAARIRGSAHSKVSFRIWPPACITKSSVCKMTTPLRPQRPSHFSKRTVLHRRKKRSSFTGLCLLDYTGAAVDRFGINCSDLSRSCCLPLQFASPPGRRSDFRQDPPHRRARQSFARVLRQGDVCSRV